MDRKIAGVVFDLFGTLVPRYPIDRHRKLLADMAALLDVDANRFTEVWIQRLDRRITGFCKDAEECILDTLEAMGARVEQKRLSMAATMRYEFMRSCVVPYPDVEDGVKTIKAMGYKLGLISTPPLRCQSSGVPCPYRGTSTSPLSPARSGRGNRTGRST